MRKRRSAALAVAIALIGVSIFGGALSASAAPNPPVITSPADGSYLPGAPTGITGNADGDNTIDVTVTNVNGTDQPYCTAQTFSGGTNTPWATGCTGSLPPLPVGDNVFTATAYLTADNTVRTASAPVTVHVYDTSTATLTTYPSGSTTDSYPDFAGAGPALGTVDVKDGSNNTLCSTLVDSAGFWTCSMIEQATGAAFAGVVARGIDQGSGVTYSSTTTNFTIANTAVPTITQAYAAPWVVDTTDVTIGGTNPDDLDQLIVQISPDGSAPWYGLCAVAGGYQGYTSWSCVPGVFFFNGPTYVRVQGIRANGEASAWSPSTLVNVVTQSTITNVGLTNDSTPTFSGTATGEGPSSIVDVMADGITGPVCSSAIVGGNWSCTAVSAIPDGGYPYRTSVDTGSAGTQHNSSIDHYLSVDTTAPLPPVIQGPSSPTTDRTPLIYGTGEYDGYLDVYVNGSPVTCVDGAPYGDDGGSWYCELANSLDNNDSYVIRVRQTDAAGNTSPLSAPYTLVVGTLSPLVPPTIIPQPTPTATPKPPLIWSFSTGGKTEFLPGDEVDITSSGLPPGSMVEAALHSVPVNLGSTIVKPDGTFTLHVVIPEDTPPGEHHFVVSVTPPGEQPSVVEVPATVKVIVKEADKSSHGLTESTGVAPGAFGVARDNPAAPSSFTHAIRPLWITLATPALIGAAAAAGIALLLLVAFPAELLNSTISEQYGRFSRRLPKVRAHWLVRFTEWLHRIPILGGALITIVAAVIFGFADPGFGLDITSARLVLACFIALFIVGYFASSLSGLILRKRWNYATAMELKPLGLILTVVGVVISRLIDFSPGFLIGLILGITLVGHTTVADRAKATLVQAGVVFALSLLGWVGYSILAATQPADSFGTALAFDTMVAVTSEGLTALFIGMIPLRFLDGQSVFAFSKPIWAASFAVAALAFALIIVPSSWGEIGGSLPVWITVVGAFAVVALGIYAYFRFLARPLEDDDAEDGEAPTPAPEESRAR